MKQLNETIFHPRPQSSGRRHCLTPINQGDRLIAGMAPGWIKMALTYLIPYCVSTHGAVTAMRDRSRGKRTR